MNNGWPRRVDAEQGGKAEERIRSMDLSPLFYLKPKRKRRKMCGFSLTLATT
jgi:hypothetical protein